MATIAKRSDFFVLQEDDLAREIRIGPVPEGIDGNGLDINPHRIHIRQALIDVVRAVCRRANRIGEAGTLLNI
jgi:hypothetical protein